eukprot:1150515-Pelagomonas_calceolata.AAC.7
MWSVDTEPSKSSAEAAAAAAARPRSASRSLACTHSPAAPRICWSARANFWQACACATLKKEKHLDLRRVTKSLC